MTATIARLIERVRELLDHDIEFETSRHPFRRCDLCHAIHTGFHRCPNRLWAVCMDCGGRKRLLDVYGRYCPAGHEPHGRRHIRRLEAPMGIVGRS